jgi:hypothetical protein
VEGLLVVLGSRRRGNRRATVPREWLIYNPLLERTSWT